MKDEQRERRSEKCHQKPGDLLQEPLPAAPAVNLVQHFYTFEEIAGFELVFLCHLQQGVKYRFIERVWWSSFGHNVGVLEPIIIHVCASVGARCRQFVRPPAGNSALDYRDRAIPRFFLYFGARLSTVCRLKVSDFHRDGDEATIRLHGKEDKRRTIGLHFQAT